MFDSTLRITMPNFEEPDGDFDNSFWVTANINNKQVGRFAMSLFDRYEFIDQAEYDRIDICFFARRLEFYEKPYLNYNGLIVFVIDDFKFDETFEIDYSVAFLKDSIEKVISDFKEEIADIYAIVRPQEIPLYERSGFETIDTDKLYGVWMHYIVNN